MVADVCDKGVGAALFMGIFRSLIRAFAELHYGTGLMEHLNEKDKHCFYTDRTPTGIDRDHLCALQIIISHINNYIALTHGNSNMFATLFWGIIDFEAKTLSYVNCGHDGLVVVGPNGIRMILEPTGPAVGLRVISGNQIPCSAIHVVSLNIIDGCISNSMCV